MTKPVQDTQTPNMVESLKKRVAILAKPSDEFDINAADIVVDTPNTRLFERRQRMNDALVDMLSAHDIDAAQDIMNDPEFQLDPSRVVEGENMLTHALCYLDESMIMTILDQPFSIVAVLLKNADVIKTIESRIYSRLSKESLIDKILSLPDGACDLVLNTLDIYYDKTYMDKYPYTKLLDRAIERNIESKISAKKIAQLMDQNADRRFDFFIHNNKNVNKGTNTNIAKRSDLLKEDTNSWNNLHAELIFHTIFLGKWSYAQKLLGSQTIDATPLMKYNNGSKSVSIPQLMKGIAKYNKLPAEAYDFIAAYEEKTGATKPIIKKRRMRGRSKPAPRIIG